MSRTQKRFGHKRQSLTRQPLTSVPGHSRNGLRPAPGDRAPQGYRREGVDAHGSSDTPVQTPTVCTAAGQLPSCSSLTTTLRSSFPGTVRKRGGKFLRRTREPPPGPGPPAPRPDTHLCADSGGCFRAGCPWRLRGAAGCSWRCRPGPPGRRPGRTHGWQGWGPRPGEGRGRGTAIPKTRCCWTPPNLRGDTRGQALSAPAAQRCPGRVPQERLRLREPRAPPASGLPSLKNRLQGV